MTEPTENGESTPPQPVAEPDSMLIILGAQGQIGTTRIGVMTVAERETGAVARLLIHAKDGSTTKVVLSPGEEFSLLSEGRATLVDILLDHGPQSRRAVRIRKLPD